MRISYRPELRYYVVGLIFGLAGGLFVGLSSVGLMLNFGCIAGIVVFYLYPSYINIRAETLLLDLSLYVFLPFILNKIPLINIMSM